MRTTRENTNIVEEVFDHFERLKNNRFTGSFSIEGGRDVKWKFYFRLGRLLWANGGNYPQERWQRNLAVFCPNILPEQIEKISEDSAKIQEEYNILSKLHKLGNTTEKKQIGKLIVNVLSEVFFDIIQYRTAEKKISYQTFENDRLDFLIILVDIDKVYQKTTKAWQEWTAAELTNYSPNLYPVIQKFHKYCEEITSKIHPNLIALIDGKYSLRALASISKQEIVNLTSTLLKLTPEGFIAFSPTPKTTNKYNFAFKEFKQLLLDSSSSLKSIAPELSSQNNNSKPLIVCIDDSPLVAQALGKFIVKKGYRFLSIKDPMNALAILLKNPPDLIFLDLIMPVINGYELCSQLRRAPNLKTVPIVILTSKDGLVDRVRAKLVGGNGFLSKPVTKEELLTTLKKYIKINTD